MTSSLSGLHHSGPESGPDAPRRVRLRRIELHGFKTFAARSVLEFAPGITAVVGPNGSGKSNVADAVRWVLGEQSLRLLRGRKSEDVIFGGGAGRAPLGMAEVQLTLENGGGALSLDFAEVEIGRRAYRSGESEYFLNRGRVRLRDVVDVLSRAGIGQHGHSVIGQGMVDLALSLRPEERRSLFQDASGQRRFQAKKDEAEARLADVRANATRIADLIAELETQVAHLQRQARRAQDEGRLRAQLRDHTAALLAHQRWELEEALRELSEGRGERLASSAKEAAAEAAASAAAVEQAQRGLAALRQDGSAAAAQRAQAREKLERARRQLAVEQERDRAAARALDELGAAVQRLRSRTQQNEAALPAASAGALRAKEALAAAKQEAADAETALSEASGDADGDAVWRQAQDVLAATARELTHVTTRLREVRQQRMALHKQRGEASQGLRHATEAAESVATRLAELDERARRRGETQEQARAAQKEIATKRAAAEQRSQGLAGQLAQLDRRVSSLEAKLAVLRDVAAAGGSRTAPNGRTQEQPQQRVVDESIPGHPIPDRRLAEHLQVPPDMETAVAAAAGDALEWVVVETGKDAAERALERARSGGDRTTFIARITDTNEKPPALPEHESGVGYLADLVGGQPGQDGVALRQVLLGSTYVVRDLPGALDLAARLNGGPRPRIVTLSGETVDRSGAITAGAPPREAAVLRQLRELRDGEADLAQVGAERERAATALAAAESELGELRSRERTAEGALRELLQQESREEGERRGIAQQQARLTRDVAWWTDYVARTEAQVSSLDTQVTALTDQKETAERAHGVANARATALADAARQRQTDLAARRERAAGARAAMMVAEHQLTQATDRLAAVHAAQRAAEDEAKRSETRLAAARMEREALGRQSAELGAAVRQLEAELAALERQAAEERQREAALEGEIERQRRIAERAMAEAAQAERQAALLEAEKATLVERRRALHEQAARELGELPPAQRADVSGAELAARVERAQRRVLALGPVNQVALQEHAEASERLAFLRNQLADLNASSAALEQAKAELEAGLVADFGRTFEAVAEHFRVYFRRLFGGGDAALSLTDPKDLVETGVEITAQLPGKRRQELALLSGGERALVAAALLFALLKTRPSPFCVMDEVDAALDEANVGRFCDVLEELACDTQFVVITHNRATMERADTLYGVTLGDDGVSRVVSLNVREAMAMTSDGPPANGTARAATGAGGLRPLEAN